MYKALLEALPPEIIKQNEPMKMHTSFRIGGPVDIMVIPENMEQIKTVLRFCEAANIPLFVVGLGSNLLVRDKGIRGVVLKIGKGLKKVEINGNRIKTQAGIRLAELSKIAAAHSLSRFEFAEGIPGSLGGAIFMNAGAYGGEMKDVIISVDAITKEGEERTFSATELNFSYRNSIFQQNSYIILAAELKLSTENQEKIYTRMKQLATSRRQKQPLHLPSAGSVFRRPEGYYVGPMVEQLGFKGFRIGGAEVSDKHAGFIVNAADATADDVLAMIKKIQHEVKQQYSVDLRSEIRVIGEE
ncbi:MAG: UDP-N-acetylmuramate dehydrogenase [Bacillota bacterium]|nr:UDP-N-acetylmuramate dehydrogenase [Bacillota bacterium]